MGKRKGQQGVSGKRKRKREISETLIREGGGDNDEVVRVRDEDEEGNDKEGRRFFACYLLTSLSPRHKGHTYIGFTVNPRRRIRQHNGEIRCGAWRTKSKRPWEMVLCIYGFPTNIAALQFEWAWQHPLESLAVRKAAAAFKSLSGLANKIKLAYTMLTLPAWQSLNLTVNFFSTKYKMHTAGCPSLPEQMKVQVCSMDELPCYTGNDWNVHENDEWDDGEDHDECVGAHGEAGCMDGMIYNFLDHQTVLEESTSEQNVSMENLEMRQPSEHSPLQNNKNHRRAFCCNNSPGRALSSFFPRSYDIEETLEDGDLLIENTSAESDGPTRKQLSTTVVVHEGEPVMKPPIVPSEVEVVDVFTPSPCYKINSHSKKRRAPNAFPEIIDLTKSPIYV